MEISRRSLGALASSTLLSQTAGPAGNQANTFSARDFGARDRTDSTDAIQAALDAAEHPRATVLLPAGRYMLSRPLRFPSFVTLMGEGMGTILDNQYQKLDAPQIVNKDPEALIFAGFHNISFNGGTHGIKLNVTKEIAGLTFENCTFDMQSDKCVEINKLLQTSNFLNCKFGKSGYGIYVSSPTSNMNNFIGCQFTDMTNAHIFLRSGEVNNFIGCRFEGGGRMQRTTIELDDARNTTFSGCYFENTHEFILSETRSSNSTSFHDCHFTGTSSDSKITPYKFRSDGVVNFGTNSWGAPSEGPQRMRLSGHNRGKLGGNGIEYGSGDKRGGSVSAPYKRIAAPSGHDILTIRRNVSEMIKSDVQMLSGSVTLHYAAQSGDGAQFALSKTFRFAVSAFGTGRIRLDSLLDANSDTAGDDRLVLREKPGTSPEQLTIVALTSAGADARRTDAVLQWSAEWSCFSTKPANSLELDVPSAWSSIA